MPRECEFDFFDFGGLKSEYNKILKKCNIIQGTVLKSKIKFISWTKDPLDPESFIPGSIFTVIDIIFKEEEYVLHCFQNEKIIEIDSFVIFFNSNLKNRSLEETFLMYFEKIL